MATTSLEVIRRVVMEAQSKGFDKLAADLDKVAKSQEGVAGSSTTVTKSQGSVDAAFARTERTLDKTMTAYQAFTRQVKATNDALEQGRTSPERAAQLIGLADAQLQKATGSTAQFTQSTGLARHELINLGRQMQDVVVSLGSGQGLGTVLLQQGAQIGDVFASMRGTVGAALTQLAGMAVRVLPVAAALGAVATAIYAVNKAMNEQREARIATTGGLGRFSDIAPGGVAQLAEQSVGAGVSLGAAREGALEFVKAGASYENTVEGMALATRVAATRGIELADAYKLLADIMRDPVAAAQQLDGAYDILTEKQKLNIATMQASGDKAGAAREVMRALVPALVSAKDATTGWGDAWAYVVTKMTQGLEVAGRIATFSPPGTETPAGRRAEEQRRAIRDNLGPATTLPGETPRQSTASLFSMQSLKGATLDAAAIAQIEKDINDQLQQQKQHRDDIAKKINDAKNALKEDLDIAFAFTTAQKAAAEAVKARNEALRAGEAPEVAKAKGEIAGQRVTGMAAAEAQQALEVQQQQIDMYGRLAAAAQTQGMAGVVQNAQLQMELQLRQQGLDVMLPENQARIQNAGILAQQAVALRDLAQATETRAAGMDQVEAYRKETDLLKENAATRAYQTEIIKAETQARALERQGMYETAAAVREVGRAMASAARERVEETERIERNRQALADEAAALRASAQARAAEAQARRQALSSEGRDPNAMPMHGGTTRGSDWPQAKTMTMSVGDQAEERKAIALYGADNVKMMMQGGFDPILMKGNYRAVGGVADPDKMANQAKQAADQLKNIAQQAQQSRLSLVMSSLSKHIQSLNETVSTSTQKAQELQQKVEASEEKRQQRIQQYLDAGPSPFEQNADIYYDPKKRLLFAEQIAGNTDQLLKQQADAAKAEADAAQAQIKGLEDQQQALQDQSELLSAGVDLSKQELTALEALIGVVRNELPANLATAYDRMQAAGVAGAQKSAEDVVGGLPLAVKGAVTRSSYGYPGATYGGISGLGYGSGATSFYSGGLGTSGSGGGGGAKLGGFASGGAFTVPGSGGVDRPFRIGLTPGERVTITPPGKRAGGGTTVERMIIQLPPGAEPIQLMNKTSRNSLTRATRRMGRMM